MSKRNLIRRKHTAPAVCFGEKVRHWTTAIKLDSSFLSWNCQSLNFTLCPQLLILNLLFGSDSGTWSPGMNFGLGVKSQQQIHDWRRKMKEDEEKTRGGVREAWISSPFYVLLPWKQVTKWVSSLSSVKSLILGNKRKGIELMLPCISCNSHWQKRNWQDKWRKQESKKRPLGLKCDLQPPAHDSFFFLLFFPCFLRDWCPTVLFKFQFLTPL